MRKNIGYAFFILLAFLLQTTLFQVSYFWLISPNLLLILTVSFAFMNGKKTGIVIGFVCGLLIDFFYGDILGFYALIYMLIGYVNGFFCRVFYEDEIKVSMFFVGASDLVLNCIVYIFLFLLRGRLGFLYYLYHIMLPELIFTVFITLIIYRPLYKWNHLFENADMRGSSNKWLRK